MPALQELILDGFLKDDEVEDVEAFVNTTNKTHLRLTLLDLACRKLGEMIQFLCILVLPSSCNLRLNIAHEGPETAPGFLLITSWLSRHFQDAPSFHSFRSTIRSWRTKRTTNISTDLRVAGFYESEEEGFHILSASILLGYDSEFEIEFIDSLCRSFLKSFALS